MNMYKKHTCVAFAIALTAALPFVPSSTIAADAPGASSEHAAHQAQQNTSDCKKMMMDGADMMMSKDGMSKGEHMMMQGKDMMEKEGAMTEGKKMMMDGHDKMMNGKKMMMEGHMMMEKGQQMDMKPDAKQ